MSPHRSDAVPMVRASHTFAMPTQVESPAARASAFTRRMSTSPPPPYTWSQSPKLAAMLDVSPNTYWPACCTNRPLAAPHACTHSHVIMAAVASWNVNWPACTPTNRGWIAAAVGRFGFSESLFPVGDASRAVSRHGSSIPKNWQPAASRYHYPPIDAATPAPDPTTGPSYQPPWPKAFGLPVPPVTVRTVQTDRYWVTW